MPVKYGDAVVHLRTDGVGYLLPFLREDHKLYRLPPCIHHIVEGIVLHRHHTEAEHHLVGALQIGTKLWEEHTRTDDAEVGSYQYVAQRNIGMVLIDRCSNDVCSTCRAVVCKDGSQGYTCHHAADDHRHEVLSFAHQFEWQSVVLLGNQFLCKHQHEVEREDGEDSLH